MSSKKRQMNPVIVQLKEASVKRFCEELHEAWMAGTVRTIRRFPEDGIPYCEELRVKPQVGSQ